MMGDETATVRMPVSVLDCPCTISLAIAKTHDGCIVTLALKNMVMGTINKKDRIHIHGYAAHKDRHLPDEVRLININMARMARHLMPDIAVIDGVVGLEGNGPGGTTAWISASPRPARTRWPSIRSWPRPWASIRTTSPTFSMRPVLVWA